MEEFVQLLTDVVELVFQFSKDCYVDAVLKCGTYKLDFSDVFDRLRKLQRPPTEGNHEASSEFGTKEVEIEAEKEDWKVRDSPFFVVPEEVSPCSTVPFPSSSSFFVPSGAGEVLGSY